jgi:hypothetical protein
MEVATHMGRAVPQMNDCLAKSTANQPQCSLVLLENSSALSGTTVQQSAVPVVVAPDSIQDGFDFVIPLQHQGPRILRTA